MNYFKDLSFVTWTVAAVKSISTSLKPPPFKTGFKHVFLNFIMATFSSFTLCQVQELTTKCQL